MQWSKARNSQGIKVILDILGESSRNEKGIQNFIID
jgi:hypothetical protein